VEYEREEVNGEKPKKVKATSPRVLILDPACGTGTFLYTVIDHIRAGFMRQENAGMWSGYVRNYLLPRIFGFELLMAPYAMAHLKLGMQLAGHDLTPAQREKWAYDFSGDDRLGVYLTNTLEEAERHAQIEFGFLRTLTEEANATVRIKRELPIMVVMGNPPYSNFGRMNTGKWILALLDGYKKDLHERKLNLDDDFIKFIRFAQWRIEQTGAGILAFISNNTYIDGITHRRMRESLLESFDEIYILDLHGSSKKHEKCPDGSKDENVFDIQQGVAVGIFVKRQSKSDSGVVYHAELWGNREAKYSALFDTAVETTKWAKVNPEAPFFFFVPRRAGGN
jgi:predicted helicase